MISKLSLLIFERFCEGRYVYLLLKSDIKINFVELLLDDKFICKNKVEFFEVVELDLVCYYIEFLNKNFGVDNGFYLLGLCMMKYNFKINEKVVRILGFSELYLL